LEYGSFTCKTDSPNNNEPQASRNFALAATEEMINNLTVILDLFVE
jgi:hypothetical protein